MAKLDILNVEEVSYLKLKGIGTCIGTFHRVREET